MGATSILALPGALAAMWPQVMLSLCCGRCPHGSSGRLGNAVWQGGVQAYGHCTRLVIEVCGSVRVASRRLVVYE